MWRTTLPSLAVLAFAASPAPAQAPAMIQCPVSIAHGCDGEKCQNIGQMPTFRIDVAGRKICMSMGGGQCETWINADLFQAEGGSVTVGVAGQRLIMWIDDKMKVRGARLSGRGVAAFFGDCKPM